MNKQVLVPDIGDFEKVEIIEVLVKQGDIIKKDDSLITLESDKSSVEVPSTEEGTIEKLSVKVGDKVSKGDLILSLTSTSNNEDTKSKIPPVTEKIIEQAEASLEKKEQKVDKNKIDKKNETNIQASKGSDIDPVETKEWQESLSAVLENDGKNRAQFLIKKLIEHS